MEQTEFTETLDLMLDDATAIVHNQMVLARIHVELERNRLNPLEPDLIYRDHFGQLPSEPRIITINDVTLTSRILHQTGKRLADIEGGDLLYEIENEKFGLIQYKRAAGSVVRNDHVQLETLLLNCPQVCGNQKRRPIPVDWVPSKIFSFCGIWYAVADGSDIRYVTACEAETIFQNQPTKNAQSFQTGLSRNTFMELFGSCRIGAIVRRPNDKETRDAYVSQLLEFQHFILEVRQRGSWLKKR